MVYVRLEGNLKGARIAAGASSRDIRLLVDTDSRL